jgi:hypothetical protein
VCCGCGWGLEGEVGLGVEGGGEDEGGNAEGGDDVEMVGLGGVGWEGCWFGDVVAAIAEGGDGLEITS